MQFERILIRNVGITVQKITAAMGKSTHSGGLPFIPKTASSRRAASLLPASAAGIHTGFICGPPDEIF